MAIPVGAVGLGSTTNKHSPCRRLRKCQFGLVHSSNTSSLAFCACVNIESHGRKRLSPVYTHTRNQLLFFFFQVQIEFHSLFLVPSSKVKTRWLEFNFFLLGRRFGLNYLVRTGMQSRPLLTSFFFLLVCFY